MYRFEVQFEIFVSSLIQIDNAYFLLNIFLFFISLICIYTFLKPKQIYELKFNIVLLLFYFYPVLNSPLMYGVMIWIVVKNKLEWIPILGLQKEFALWQLAGYYIILDKDPNNKKKAIMYCSVGFLVYLVYRIIVWVIIGNTDMPGISYVFGFLYAPSYIFNLFLPYVYPIVLSLLISFFIIVEKRRDIYLLLWNFLPIIIFGLFWEIQLWAPILFLIICNNQELKIKEIKSTI